MSKYICYNKLSKEIFNKENLKNGNKQQSYCHKLNLFNLPFQVDVSSNLLNN